MKTSKKLLASVLTAALLMSTGCAGREQMQTEPTPPQQTQTEVVEPVLPSGSEQPPEKPEELPPEVPEQQPHSGVSTIEFPIMVEDGKLKLESLFQFSGFNPDCGGAEGKDIAGLQLTNVSSSHLERAELKVTLRSGKTVTFVVEDIPAGRNVMAFETENVSMDMEDPCTDIRCDAVFSNADHRMSDQVMTTVDATQVRVTNISGMELKNLIVRCHCVLDKSYFGGLTYCYPIDSLPAGAELTIDAWECYLGQAEVVCIGRAG